MLVKSPQMLSSYIVTLGFSGIIRVYPLQLWKQLAFNPGVDSRGLQPSQWLLAQMLCKSYKYSWIAHIKKTVSSFTLQPSHHILIADAQNFPSPIHQEKATCSKIDKRQINWLPLFTGTLRVCRKAPSVRK